MTTIDVTNEEFGELVSTPGIAIVDFWAEWCGPCRQFAPIFEMASQAHPEISFIKVDTEAERELAAAAQISAIPTLMIFRDGILVYRESGALPSEALEDLISQVESLDMVAVRAKLEELRNQSGTSPDQ